MPFWKPKEAGEKVSGEFRGFFQTQYSICFGIRPDGWGESELIYVPLNAVLLRIVKENSEKFEVGKQIEIRYLGRAGRANIFSVYLNGEDISGLRGFTEVKKTELLKVIDHLLDVRSFKRR